MLPLLPEELGCVPAAARGPLAAGLATCLGLNTAAYQLWLSLGSGNANFFYGMNLLWAGWQAVALVQLVKAGVRAEGPAAPPQGG